MYKLLVADDEQIVLDSIRYIIDKNFDGNISVSTARSGREAIEAAETLKPDIVFMDISMPGINGIEAIKEIKSIYRQAVFIIITAYDQFDFAKEAVKLGVYEYLLKPVNRMKIVEIINKSIELIENEREKRRKELELKERLESIIPILENGFIYSILFFEDNRRELGYYKEFLNITEEYGYIMIIEFGETNGDGVLSNKIGFSVKSQSFYPYFRDTIKRFCKCIVGPVMLNRIIAFVMEDSQEEEYDHRLKALKVAEQIYEIITEKTGADFQIGIGKSYKGIENLCRSYEESVKAIKKAGSKGVVHYMDLPAEIKVDTAYIAEMEKTIIEKACSGDTDLCLQAFNQIFECLQLDYADNLERIRTRIIELMVLIHRTVAEYGDGEDGILTGYDYIHEILDIKDAMILKAWCKERLKNISHLAGNIRQKKLSKIIVNAKKFIDENYFNEISLDDVARGVNISPNYFCKLFKDETGENYVEYLTFIRIQKAKEFLEEGKYSVKEVCYQVGYSDPNYFSRIFKKVTGITPTEFKDRTQE
ncbi:MAG: response regulator [Clostridia bacterium]|nr:response regulator [Clostridia bacterium]